ncbi:MAG: ATP-binding protein [Verrucomicrobiales bacterium]
MLHLVCGPPAAGKTTYARTLAASLGAVLFDSDQVAEKLVRAGLILAGLDPNDRDSPAYKAAYRDTVYETLYDLAATNLPNVPVVIAGPFTRECADAGWPQILHQRFGELPEIHFIWCPPELRLRRIVARGEARDRPKIESWESYVVACREEPPAFPHRLVVTYP